MSNTAPRGGFEGEQLGPYRLVRKLGRGGMGEVWLAEHETIKSQVAIKLVLAAPDDEDAASRFVREAKATARIRHPGVVTVTDFGRRPSGGAYLVMEVLEGETLGDRLERGALSTELAIDLGTQIAEALAAAHASGVIHRDLKPANVFLVRDAAARSDVRVKLVDFGVAKATGKVTDELGMTVTGALVGTPRYMAPEQCSSRLGAIDARADLYALGVVLYEMLTGKTPFLGPTLGDLIDQHLNETPTPPRTLVTSIPAKLDVLVVMLLAKDRVDRPATANDVARVLHELRGTAPVPSPTEETLAAVRVTGTDATVDSAAQPAVGVTQATGLATPAPTLGAGSPAVSAAGTRAVKSRFRIVAMLAGAVLAILAGVVLVLMMRSDDAKLDLATATPAQLEAACHDRDGRACHALATRTRKTDAPDLSRVFALELAACDVKITDGCTAVAAMYLHGVGVRPDYPRARKLAEAACRDGNAAACDLAGDVASDGLDVPPDVAAALAFWKRGCELGAPSACETASRTLSLGIGTRPDPVAGETLAARARLAATKGCDRDEAASCRILGHVFARGLAGDKDLARGVGYLQRGCELGDADACGEAGEFYALGIGVAKNPEHARRYLQRGCDHGSGSSCETLAVAVANGLVGSIDVDAAFTIATRACETHGDLHCAILGNFHQIGVGTPRSPKSAAAIYERACGVGVASACTSAATIEVEGRTIDPAKRHELIVKACDLGDAGACEKLGTEAKQAKDDTTALGHFERACTMSDGQTGCESLAKMLFGGRGTPADPERALKLLVDGCEVKVAPMSCLVLGIRYREGAAVPKDPAKAVRFFDKTCATGYAEGCISAADLLLDDASGIGRDERRAVTLIETACQVEARFCSIDTKQLGHRGLFKREAGASGGGMLDSKSSKN